MKWNEKKCIEKKRGKEEEKKCVYLHRTSNRMSTVTGSPTPLSAVHWYTPACCLSTRSNVKIGPSPIRGDCFPLLPASLCYLIFQNKRFMGLDFCYCSCIQYETFYFEHTTNFIYHGGMSVCYSIKCITCKCIII